VVKQNTLSLCMIARDEASFLERCLASAAPHVDEIIVVDTGSSDGTVRVARAAGAEVSEFEWTDDFAEARNASLSAASGDWILLLDCDEVIAERDWPALRAAVGRKGSDAYRLTTRNYARDPHRVGFVAVAGEYAGEEKDYVGWFPTTKVRLFRNDDRVRFVGALDELVETSIQQMGGVTDDLDVPVHHYGYVEKERPTARYAVTAKTKANQMPDSAAAHYELALALRDDNQLIEAERAISRGLDLIEAGVDPGPYVQPAFAYLVAGDVAGQLSKHGDSTRYYERAIEIDGKCFQAMNNLGTILMREGSLDEAERLYKQAGALAPEVPAIQENLRRVRMRLEKEAAMNEGGRLTLCMIAGNEEERLPRCLESVQGLVDEIVVVDTGSTDRTVEIAKSFGAKLGYFEWCDDWSAARNESIKLATGDWILWLDPDDILPVEMHSKIRAAMARGKGGQAAYFFVLDDQGYEPVTCLQLRLFPNVPGVEFSQPVHEQLTPSLAKLGIPCEPTDIRVVHTGYTTPEVVRAKQEKYHGIMEKWLETHPADYIVRSHVAQTCYVWGRLDESIEHYGRIIEDSACNKDHNLIIETTARLFLGRCLMRKGENRAALSQLKQAHALDDQYAMTNLTLGECYLRLGEHTSALRSLDQAEAYEGQVTFSAVDPVALRYSIRFARGQALEALGRLEEAAIAFEAASEIDPKRTGALGALSTVMRMLGRREDAVGALDRALRIDPDHPKHLFNRGTYHLESDEEEEARAKFDQARLLDPTMHEPYLNLGFLARRNGQPQEAEEMYRMASTFEDGAFEAHSNLGHLLMDQSRFAEAAEAFTASRVAKQGLLDIDLGLCAAYCGLQNIDGAINLLPGILASVYEGSLGDGVPLGLTPEALAQLLAESGRMLIEKQLIPCARLAYQGAYLSDPRAVHYGLQLAEIYNTTGQSWLAVEVYESLIQSFPTEPELFRKLGASYTAMGAVESAEMCAQQVWTLERGTTASSA
jgi:glycosyltransferase involved in cell wall biosynthesis/Tfp pilus assembly protein PilF